MGAVCAHSKMFDSTAYQKHFRTSPLILVLEAIKAGTTLQMTYFMHVMGMLTGLRVKGLQICRSVLNTNLP